MPDSTPIRVTTRRVPSQSLTFLGFAFLATLLSATAFGATLRMPEITAITRESPASVGPGDTLTYRYTLVPGSSPVQSVTLVFDTQSKRTFRALRTQATASGVVSVTIPSTWVNDRYTLTHILVHDTWERYVYYSTDGLVQGNPGPPLSGDRHGFDFTTLGFELSGAYSGAVRPQVSALTATGAGPYAPGETARFTYTLEPGPVPLASVAFNFRILSISSATYTATIANPQHSGELAIPVVTGMTNGNYSLIGITYTDTEGRVSQYRADMFTVVETLHGWSLYFEPESYSLNSPVFRVTGAMTSGPSSSRFGTLTRDGTGDVGAGDTVRFNYTTIGNGLPVQSVRALMTGPYGVSRSFASEGASGTLSIPITSDWITGPHSLLIFYITDAGGRTTTSGTGGSSAYTFNVRGTTLDPVFIVQPPAETPVKAGNSVTLSAVGLGIGLVTYQWYRGEPGDTSTPVPSLSGSSDGTRMSATITQPTTFWVRMTNAGQTVDSRAARVITVGPPVITRHPVSQAVTAGGTATFTVAATTSGRTTYEWSGGIPTGTARDQPSLTLTANGTVGSTLVTCTVTDVGGSTTSNSAVFSVLSMQEGLRVTTEPADITTNASSFSMKFTARVTGAGPFLYRWQKDGVDIRSDGNDRVRPSHTSSAGSISPELTFYSFSAADNGSYRVIVSNAHETIYSREARFLFTEAPMVTTQPQASVVSAGVLSLQGGAVGANPLSIQWRKDGVPIPRATEFRLYHTASGAAIAGIYDMVVTNAFGSVTSAPSRVTYQPAPPAPRITTAPASRTAVFGEVVTFTVTTTNADRFVWAKDGRILQDGPASTLTLNGVGFTDSGFYQVRAYSTAAGQDAVAQFSLTIAGTAGPPAIARHPADAIVARGSTIRIHVGVSGSSLNFQWRRNGVPLPATSESSTVNQPILVITNFDSAWVGEYDVVVTNSQGSATSNRGRLSLPPPSDTNRLLNLSVRAPAGGEHGPLIVGFVIGGGVSEDVPLLVRAAGPALASFGVAGTLGNPQATLYRNTSPRFANDDWAGSPYTAATAARLGAFPFPTSDVRDAAFAPMLAPGAYTVHVTGAGGTSGIALAEIYDATNAQEFAASRPRLLNLSVQTGVTPDSPVIVGFVLGGNRPRQMLVRAIGPALAVFGVQGALSDPQLALRNGDTLVASNDDWAGDTGVRNAATASGAFALSSTTSKDAALVTTLAPGSYTAQVTGAASASGLVLVEVYEMP